MRNHLERCLERHSRDGEEGFTLIELLVVLLIIGILLGIAIPTYLSLTSSANKTAAQSNLQTALTGAKAYFASTGNQTYTGILSTSITGTSLTYNASSGSTAGTSSSPSTIAIDPPSGEAGAALVMTAPSTNGSCYAIIDLEANIPSGQTLANLTSTTGVAGTWYAKFAEATGGTCTTSAAEASTVNYYSSSTAASW